MPRKDEKLASVNTASTHPVDEVPQPCRHYLDLFTALPVKVLVRNRAESKLMIICPHLDPVWLMALPIDQLQRINLDATSELVKATA